MASSTTDHRGGTRQNRAGPSRSASPTAQLRDRGRKAWGLFMSRSGEFCVSAHKNDTKSLIKLRDALGSQFISGAVIHTGEQTLPLGDRLWGIPISGLWGPDL